MIRQKIADLIKKAVEDTGLDKPEFFLESPENKYHGDYSSNVALKIAKLFKMAPMKIAENLQPRLLDLGRDLIEKAEIKEPGFINFFVSSKYLQNQVGEILKQKESFGKLKIGRRQKINIEFISANPTGPLHVGNARGGYCGDVLANVLNRAGYDARREYYVNDRGRQIKFLQDTLNGNAVYKNEYTDELIRKGEKDVKKAVDFIVGKIKETVKRMGIKFDKWVYETELYKGETNKVLAILKGKNLVYEKDGALWFKSTQFGDDKDRVLIRAQEKTTYEEETYLLSDIAYLNNKFKRKFNFLIIFLGAEHHGYVGRLKAAAEALGYGKDKVVTIVFQLVRLIEGGKELKMSKRTGVFVTVDELLDNVPPDVARFFFLTRSSGSHLNFELDLAKTQSEKNPVYYVQYAYARICSIIRKAKMKEAKPLSSLLEHPSELKLIKQLIKLPEVVEDTAKDYQIQRLPQYAVDLATVFHQFYRDCKVLTEDSRLSAARLSLILATQIVLKNTLSLMGISAPEKM